MTEPKNTLDINQLIALIKENIQNGITTDYGKKFFGNITINFEHGKTMLIEKNETIK